MRVPFGRERHWHFFKDADIGNTGTNQAVDVDTRATSLMGNLVVPIRVTGAPGWRPYAVAGAGVVRASFNRAGPSAPDAHQADLALGAGTGVIRSLGSLVGLRLDLRYFRAFADQDKPLPAGQIGEGEGVYRDYGFWRVTVGVTFGFPREGRRLLLGLVTDRLDVVAVRIQNERAVVVCVVLRPKRRWTIVLSSSLQCRPVKGIDHRTILGGDRYMELRATAPR